MVPGLERSRPVSNIVRRPYNRGANAFSGGDELPGRFCHLDEKVDLPKVFRGATAFQVAALHAHPSPESNFGGFGWAGILPVGTLLPKWPRGGGAVFTTSSIPWPVTGVALHRSQDMIRRDVYGGAVPTGNRSTVDEPTQLGQALRLPPPAPLLPTNTSTRGSCCCNCCLRPP